MGLGKLCVAMSPFFAAVSVMYHYGAFETQQFPTQHHYQQMRKEADKQWPSSNKKLDWMIALAHGT
jgi:hypothetical protein